MFNRSVVAQGQHSATNNNNSGGSGASSNTADISMRRPDPNNVYQNMNQEYEQPNVLTSLDEKLAAKQ